MTSELADQYAGQSGPCVRCRKPVSIPAPEGLASPAVAAMLKKRGRFPRELKALVLLVVGLPVLIVCLALFVLWLLSAVRAARESAQQAQCVNNLKQIGLAMHSYHRMFGCFPPAFIPDSGGKPMHSWRVLLLPYLGETALYAQYRFDEPWNGPHNASLAPKMPAVYRCPSDTESGGLQVSYAMLVGRHAISDGPTPHAMSDVKDGLSNTIMVAEAADSGINWLEPRDLDADHLAKMGFDRSGGGFRFVLETKIKSHHPDKVNVLVCDGSVCTLHALTIGDETLLSAIATIDGGENYPPSCWPLAQ